MQVTVVLFGMLREKLAKESKGRLLLTFPDQATLEDLLVRLHIDGHVICSINGHYERDRHHPLRDGDIIQLMQAIGGGNHKLRFSANISMLFTEVDFLQRFFLAAKAGFKAVEFLFPYENGIENVRRQLQENGLTVALFNLPPGDIREGEWGTLSNPYRRDYFRQSFMEALNAAEKLGCRCLNTMFGQQVEGLTVEQQFDCAVENLSWAALYAAQAGVQLLIEPLNPVDFPKYALTKTQHALDIIRTVNHPSVGLQYDLYHAQKAEGNLIETIKNCISLIRHIQIADVPDRHEPGTGEINFKAVFNLLEQLGYDGYIGLEYKPSSTTRKSLRWLKVAERSFV